MDAVCKKLFVLAAFVLLPRLLFAQASITGTVKDTSGAVLPGVTVEASSPALIEKARSAVTDSDGLYRIVDLRPGTYTVTFTLPGFTTVKREGIELTGSVTLTIPLEMKVGDLQETITVTGETPVVDVQNTRARDGDQRGRHPGAARDARLRLAAERHARASRSTTTASPRRRR